MTDDYTGFIPALVVLGCFIFAAGMLAGISLWLRERKRLEAATLKISALESAIRSMRISDSMDETPLEYALHEIYTKACQAMNDEDDMLLWAFAQDARDIALNAKGTMQFLRSNGDD